MTTLNIAFASGFAADGAFLFPALTPPITVTNVTISGTSTQSAAAPSGTRIARVCSHVSCWIVIGDNPIASNTTGIFIPQLAPMYVSINSGQKIAVIA